MKVSPSIILAALVVALVVGAFIGHAFNSTSATQTTITTTAIQQTTSIPSGSTTVLSGNNTVTQVLYKNKTISLAAPQYNPNYNHVTGCYYVGGYYNFSFYAPYSGYIVFNETNNGIPTNFTTYYVSAYFSTEKPRYIVASAYNGSSWCTGETIQSNIAPYTQITPYNNQTMIIPVTNGTNYVVLYNWNANDQHGVTPFPVNVIFSMKYYGFKNVDYPVQPPFNFNKTISILWGKYP